MEKNNIAAGVATAMLIGSAVLLNNLPEEAPVEVAVVEESQPATIEEFKPSELAAVEEYTPASPVPPEPVQSLTRDDEPEEEIAPVAEPPKEEAKPVEPTVVTEFPEIEEVEAKPAPAITTTKKKTSKTTAKKTTKKSTSIRTTYVSKRKPKCFNPLKYHRDNSMIVPEGLAAKFDRY